jgi:hypothetical protein
MTHRPSARCPDSHSNVLQPDQARSGLVRFPHAGHPWQASSGNQIRETRHHTGLRT